MAATYTPEQREKMQQRIAELVIKNGRMTMSELERETGASWHTLRRCLVDVLSSGSLFLSGKHGVFPSEKAFNVWRKTQTKKRVKCQQEMPRGEIRPYDRHNNVICRECRHNWKGYQVHKIFGSSRGAGIQSVTT